MPGDERGGAGGRWRRWALIPVALPASILTWPLLLVPPLFFKNTNRDGALLLAVAAGTVAGQFAPRVRGRGIPVALSARGLATVALAMAVGLLVGWPSEVAFVASPAPALAPWLVGFGVAAASAASAAAAAEGRDSRWPWGIPLGLFLGSVFPLRAFENLVFLPVDVVVCVPAVAAAGLVARRRPRVAGALLCFSAIALATPRAGNQADLLRALTGTRMRGFGMELILGVLYAAAFLLAWRVSAPRFRRGPRGTLVEQLQHNPWILAGVIAAVSLTIFLFGEELLFSRTRRAPPGWRMLLWGTTPVLLAFFAHVTANAHGLLRRSAGYAAVPIGLCPLWITLPGKGDAFAAVAVLVYVGLCWWALASLICTPGRRVTRAGAVSFALLLAVGFCGSSVDRVVFLVFLWVLFVPLAFHTVVVSPLSTRWIARWGFLIGTLAGQFTAYSAGGSWHNTPTRRIVGGLCVMAAWWATTVLVVAARRFRISSPLPPGHPILTDYRAHDPDCDSSA